MSRSINRAAGCVAPLFVPANRPERFTKAALSRADAIILDLEDAVAPSDKDFARSQLRTDFTELPIFVRINAVGTPWYEADLAAVSSLAVAGIVVPKAELGENLDAIAQTCPPVLALIESAQGMADVRSIAKKPGIVRLVFGSLDYCADLGIAHEREYLVAARSELVLASRCAGIQPPIDGVTTTIDEADTVARDASYARKLGFGGKLAIHPGQVEAILAGFRPSPEETAWAERILSSGDGVARVGSMMVDEPVRARALRILAHQR